MAYKLKGKLQEGEASRARLQKRLNNSRKRANANVRGIRAVKTLQRKWRTRKVAGGRRARPRR